MKFLRFDKKTTRSERLQTDKLYFISEVWKKFIESSVICSKPGLDISIDEQLFSSKTRCRFTQYLPAKPDMFGIEFWHDPDVDSIYVLNGFPYLCKDEERPVNLSVRFARKFKNIYRWRGHRGERKDGGRRTKEYKRKVDKMAERENMPE
ncbi:piggyBac transposable element-derived protein 4 [Trichonephila clavipes]|nr:piggyBac transposable element-derived protein 4 [Trichonephila clavipes]